MQKSGSHGLVPLSVLISGVQRGTSADDEIRALPDGSQVWGLEGNDTLFGGGGPDTLLGGSGDDVINAWVNAPYEFNLAVVSGGEGNDVISGSASNDQLAGDDGDDFISDFGGSNWLQGGNGSDSLIAAAGNDTLDGGDGDDALTDVGGDNLLRGGNGNDTIDGGEGAGNSSLDGGAGDDYLQIGWGNNLLQGGAGRDTIYGGVGDDTLEGGDGDDLLQGEQGDNVFLPGQGRDTMQGGDQADHYTLTDINQLILDSGGTDTAIVQVDFYKRPAGIEKWQLAEGVQALPYWVDALLPPGIQADVKQLGQARTMQYCFVETEPDYFDNQDAYGFAPFNAEQRVLARQALDYISSICGLQFIETSNPYGRDIISFANNLQANSSGYANFPSDLSSGSDVFLDASEENSTNQNPVAGTYGAYTLIHELGHALGLRHPFAQPDANGNSEEPPFLQGREDSSQWSVMSYHSDVAQYALKFSALDVAALQYLYGPSRQEQKNDRIVLQANTTNLIWDGGGDDTIDAGTLSQPLRLHLAAGSWDYIGPQAGAMISDAGQISINFGSEIEHAIGGRGDDMLVGSALGNQLFGMAGDDSLQGGGGNDSLDGGEGSDTVIFTGPLSQYQITRLDIFHVQIRDANGGLSDLRDIEKARFADQEVRLLGYMHPPRIELANEPIWQNSQQLQLGGQADANNVVEIFANGKTLGQTQADAAGIWHFLSAPLPDGAYALQLQAIDPIGYLSEIVSAGNYQIDSLAPAAPQLQIALNPAGRPTGEFPTFSGSSEANLQIELTHKHQVLGRTRSDADGFWQLTLAENLAEGRYVVVARARDAAGNLSPNSAAQTFEVVTHLQSQGTAHADEFISGAGNDSLNGGAGVDVVRYAAPRSRMQIEFLEDGLQVTDSSWQLGQDRLQHVERLIFTDAALALDLSGDLGFAGQIARLYHASLQRAPDPQGMGFWLYQRDHGASLTQIAQAITGSAEFAAQVQVEPEQLLPHLYQTVLQRAPDEAGLAYWQAALQDGSMALPELILAFSESVEHQARLATQIAPGIWYEPFL